MRTYIFLFGLILLCTASVTLFGFDPVQPNPSEEEAANSHKRTVAGCILVDTETGELITNPAAANPEKSKHYCVALDAETGKGIRIDSLMYEARCSNGTPVTVIKDAMQNPAAQTNAHGITFSGGEYWINHPQVQILLDNDGYTRIENPEPGDIAIFRAKENYMLNERVQVKAGTIHHSMIVVGKTETGEPLLVGLRDFETHLKLQTLATCLPWPSQVTYYRGEHEERRAVFTILQRYPYQREDAAAWAKKGLESLVKQAAKKNDETQE